MRISANGAFAHVEYVFAAIKGYKKIALIYSCFERSEIALRGFTANISIGNANLYPEKDAGGDITIFPKTQTINYHTKLMRGKEPINHALCISEELNETYIVTSKESQDKDIYNWLMNHFDLPLLTDWMPYLREAGKEYVSQIETEVYGVAPEWAKNALVYEMSMTEAVLQELVTNGLRNRRIKISDKPQKPLQFDNMDDYFMKYGSSLIENLEKKLNPLVELKDTVDEIAFLKKRYFPQQAAIVNGLMECMRHSSYAFLNEDMGCGKTLQGMGVPEGFFVKKIMEENHISVESVYKDSSLVKYRNIIMCPSHLVEKWKEAIQTDIPYAKVVVIKSIKELCRLRKQGKERTGKEFYILSKETGKLSYTYVPLPSQIKKKKPIIKRCKNCKDLQRMSTWTQCTCGCKEWELEECGFQAVGMVCPECNQLLYPADTDLCKPSDENRPLQPSDFATQTKANHVCRNCGTSLWQPACEPVNRTLSFKPITIRKKSWVKMTHWANKAKKNKKSVWVHDKWKEEYIAENDLDENEITYPKITGVRKYAPSRYIKKYLKGYFDFAIFDEAHEYKGGGSAQGFAMHDLVKASRWQLALTGTIAGGYASHFFYLLFRLDPRKMRSMGYTYDAAGERRFVERYGTIATEYEVENGKNGNYNTMSRGRMIGSPKCRPGISLSIFTDFLMDKAVFLNLSDMSSYLPPLNETVEYVPLEDEIYGAYSNIREKMKTAMIEQQLGNSILGSFLQFSLSYTDKPYGRSDVLSPIDGGIITEIPDLSYLTKDGKLLNKERRLCEIVKYELKEERNVFVYCEYTGKGEAQVTKRLKEIITRECGLRAKEVEILESSNPPAEEREAWMHQMAAKGVRVFITNPRCVKTGLDFLFEYKNATYNYPTIIFYQYSYDLFTMWQASRRHYRLNQILECRTIYLLSERTIQIDALEMVASKQVATSAIQGHFSSEGLCAMAQGVDPKIKLAQAVTEKTPEQMKGLKSMFDVLNQWHSSTGERQEHKQMKTFEELTGIDITTRVSSSGGLLSDTGESIDLFDLFGLKTNSENRIKEENMKSEMPQEEETVEEETIEEDLQEEQAENAGTNSNALFTSFLLDAGSISEIFSKSGKRKKKSGKEMPTLFGM